MANVLVVHQNFPGQFINIAQALKARGDRVIALGGSTARQVEGIPLVRWSAQRGSTRGIFDPATRAEADFIRGDAAVRAAAALRDKGFTPDLIVAHPGWGEGLFLKEIWPEARVLLFGEMLYRTTDGDVGFDPEFAGSELADKVRVHAKNASQVLAYAFADAIICPTHFQASTFPASLQHLIRIIHEGVDLEAATHRPDAAFELPDGRKLRSRTSVISFVSRTLEPQRGFHIFMRALPEVLETCPEAEVVIVGDQDRRGYGPSPPEGKSWKNLLLEEMGDRLDTSRLHFTGPIEHSRLVDLFSISSAHVYLTYPFVLSWSLLEAMACECLLIASDTAPVRDAIQEGEEGLLFPFFDVAALSDRMIEALKEPDRFAPLRKAARVRVVKEFGREQGTAQWLSVIDELLAKESIRS